MNSEAALAIRRIIRQDLEDVELSIRRGEKTVASTQLAAAVAQFKRGASGLSMQ